MIKKLIQLGRLGKDKLVSIGRTKLKDIPEFTVINVNEECFFKCRMCQKWKPDLNIKDHSGKMTTSEIKGFIKELAGLVPQGHTLNFAGGEPFLRSDMIEIISYASKLGFYTQIATNGWLIDSEAKAEEIVRSGLGGIIFSIDAPSAKTHDHMRGKPGSFDRAVKAIEMLGRYRDSLQGDREFNDRLCISIQTVLCELNYKEGIAMIDWVDGSDIRSVHFNAVSEPNNISHDPYWYKNEFSELWPKDMVAFQKVIDMIYERKKKGSKIAESLGQINAYRNYFKNPEDFVKSGPCNFDKSLTLSSTGDIFMCFNFQSLGNIRQTRFADAWTSKHSEEIRQKIRGCRQNCHFLINCYYGE